MSYEHQGLTRSDGLADVLERILDKGIVIAGDVSVSLVGIELLTIRLRLLIATVDKAKDMGISWWESDPRLASSVQGPSVAPPSSQVDSAALLQRLESLEKLVAGSVARDQVTL